MSEAAEAPRGGALSLDEAVALLDRRDDAGGEGAELGGPEDPDDEFEGAARSPKDAPEWAENPDGEAEEEAEAEEAGDVDRLAPPKYWSKDAKARFAELDPELQAVVLAQEGPREEAAAKAKAEARQVREAAEHEAEQVRRFAAELSQFLPEALEQMNAHWGPEPDWAEFARQNGVEAMSYAKAQHEADQGRLQRLARAAEESEVRAHHAYVRSEFEKLKGLDPELADASTGADRRTEVTRYLHGFGVPPQALFKISALEMSLARKAMLWDQAQAKAGKSNPTLKAAPAATRPLTRGGAASGAVDPKARTAAQARNRFARSRSVEDAVALLNAQGD